MAAQRDPQHKVPVHRGALHGQIPLHQIHQPLRVRRHPAHRPHHIDSMPVVPGLPRLVRPLVHQPRPVVPLVERERHKARLRRDLPAALIPRRDGARRKVAHVLLGLVARVVQPEAGYVRGRARGRELIETIDVHEEPCHGDRRLGDGRRVREGLEDARHGGSFTCAGFVWEKEENMSECGCNFQ